MRLKKGEIGFADLLGYDRMVAPGVLAMKNGSYLMGYRYFGPDFESATKEEIEHLAAMTNKALKRLGNGWMVHFETIRKISDDYPSNRFTEPTNILIDQERAIQHKGEGTHFETAHYIFFTYLPPALNQSKLYTKILSFISGEDIKQAHEDEDRIIRDMENAVLDVLDVFGQGVGMYRLGYRPDMTPKGKNGQYGTEELLTVLNYLIGAHWQPIYLTPSNTMYLASTFAWDTANEGKYLKMIKDYSRDDYIVMVSITNYPLETYPNMLESLSELPFEMRWSNRFIFVEPQRLDSILGSFSRKWRQKIRSFLAQIMQNDRSPVNQDAVNMVDDIEEAQTELRAGYVTYGQHTSVVIARAETQEEVNRISHEIVQVVARCGFSARPETVNNMEAFLGSLPGHGYENVRKPYISTINLADIVPLADKWSGTAFNPSPEIAKYYKRVGVKEQVPALIQATSIGSTPFRLNLHVSDLGHTLVLGPSGSGKSTLLSLIVSQFERYKDAQIFCFDKGYSMFAHCASLLDSVHYDLGRDDNKLSLCPLAELDSTNDIGAAAEWLESMLILQGGEISPQRRNAVSEALKILADSTAKLTNKAEHRTITDFIATLQNEDLRQIFTYYSFGNTGEMLDGKSNDIKYAKTTVFELEHLFNMDSKILRLLCLFLSIFSSRLRKEFSVVTKLLKVVGLHSLLLMKHGSR